MSISLLRLVDKMQKKEIHFKENISRRAKSIIVKIMKIEKNKRFRT